MKQPNKLYVHQDKLVDLEFINAYKQIARAAEGEQGPQGPAGADGADGASHILTLKGLVTTVNSDVLLGLLPQYSFVIDIIGIIGANFNTHTNIQSIQVFDADGYYYYDHDDVVNTSKSLPIRVLPTTDHLVNLTPQWNKVNLVAKTIYARVEGTVNGELYVCLSYTIMPELQSLSS
jgi:hypothetical protein